MLQSKCFLENSRPTMSSCIINPAGHTRMVKFNIDFLCLHSPVMSDLSATVVEST